MRRPAPRRRPVTRRPAPRPRTVLRFTMPSNRGAVAAAVARVLGSLDGATLTPEQRDDLSVAVAEALSNAAVHGNRLRAESVVRVAVSVTADGGAVVDVSDSGPGFDLERLRDPTHPERILLPGGRGVFLMRRLVDRVEYNRAGNRVRLLVAGRREGGR